MAAPAPSPRPKQPQSWLDWGMTTYRFTRQYVSERFGRGSKTVDLGVDARLTWLNDTSTRLSEMRKLVAQLQGNLAALVGTETALGICMHDLGMRSPGLEEDFTRNADVQRRLSRASQLAIIAMAGTAENLATLTDKAVADCMSTVHNYEAARTLYDAARVDLERLELPEGSTATPDEKLEAARKEFADRYAEFEQLRQDVHVKLSLLDAHKNAVLRRTLPALHEAMLAFVTGDVAALERIVAQKRTSVGEWRPEDVAALMADPEEDDGDGAPQATEAQGVSGAGGASVQEGQAGSQPQPNGDLYPKLDSATAGDKKNAASDGAATSGTTEAGAAASTSDAAGPSTEAAPQQ